MIAISAQPPSITYVNVVKNKLSKIGDSLTLMLIEMVSVLTQLKKLLLNIFVRRQTNGIVHLLIRESRFFTCPKFYFQVLNLLSSIINFVFTRLRLINNIYFKNFEMVTLRERLGYLLKAHWVLDILYDKPIGI